MVLIPIWAAAPDHYTYLEAHRDAVTAPWHLVYSDSLEQPSESSMSAAQHVARRLHLWRHGQEWPDQTKKGKQTDGWTCGLWVLRWIEMRV